MEFKAKLFSELSLKELYEIIKSRAEIFLLEQNIICQDLDGKDYESMHCFIWENERAIACLRAFLSDEKEKIVTVGRVLTLQHKNGLGRDLMQKSLEKIKEHFSCKKILIHAQTHAIGFYEKFGFEVVSDEFMEEGVMHVTMELKF